MVVRCVPFEQNFLTFSLSRYRSRAYDVLLALAFGFGLMALWLSSWFLVVGFWFFLTADS
jgi:hypothetical protein